MKCRYACSVLVLLSLTSSVCAEIPEPFQQNWAERSYHSINDSLQDTANWIDYFFADERFEDEQAWTRLKLQWTNSTAEGEDIESDIRLNGKIILPNLERRWQLVFEGDPNSDDITGLSEDENSTAAIRYVAKQGPKKRLSFDVGIGGGFSDPSFRTRVNYRTQKQVDPWLFRLRPVLEYDSRDGWQAYVRNDNERKLSDTLFFRSSTVPRWREDTDGYLFEQNFSLFKKIGDRRYVALDWLNNFVTDPHGKLDVTKLRVRYRREVWQDKLFLEVGPGVRFQAEDHHKAELEGYLRLELLFEKRKPAISTAAPSEEAAADDGSGAQ